jgi:hypothetical protein
MASVAASALSLIVGIGIGSIHRTPPPTEALSVSIPVEGTHPLNVSRKQVLDAVGRTYALPENSATIREDTKIGLERRELVELKEIGVSLLIDGKLDNLTRISVIGSFDDSLGHMATVVQSIVSLLFANPGEFLTKFEAARDAIGSPLVDEAGTGDGEVRFRIIRAGNVRTIVLSHR